MKSLRNELMPMVLLVLLAVAPHALYAHSGKPKYHVIVDTDAASDDLRAVTMLLACNDVRVLGITGSQGSLTAKAATDKVASLLACFYHEGIPIGQGRTLDKALPAWNTFVRSIPWGNPDFNNPIDYPKAVDLLNEVTQSYPQKITLIALGALTNYADWFKNNPEKVQIVDRIIWYNSLKLKDGFNYQEDPESYSFIKSLSVPLEIVSNDRPQLIYNQQFMNKIDTTGSVYAHHLSAIFHQIEASDSGNWPHLGADDDLVPLFLTCPIVFTTADQGNPANYTLEKNIPNDYVIDLVSTILKSSQRPNNRVFIDFPVRPDLYKPVVAGFLSRVTEAYGLTEWKSVVLTNEIHGHTGIYSIIGVKMGVRALEYFNVGVNNLQVVTFVGSEPPLSCLNDGIQISTGATIGQGLIRVDEKVLPTPTVRFSFNGRSITIQLKKDIADRIEADIRKGVQLYGMSDRYWAYVEDLAYRYWQELDRHLIFTIEPNR